MEAYVAARIEAARDGEAVEEKAPQPDEECIAVAVEHHVIPRYLEERKIRAQYAVPQPYASVLTY